MKDDEPMFPFDRVVLTDNGVEHTLSPKEFFALPLANRIQYVVKQRVVFYAADVALDAKRALAEMRRLRAQPH